MLVDTSNSNECKCEHSEIHTATEHPASLHGEGISSFSLCICICVCVVTSHVWNENAISRKTSVCSDSKTWCLSRSSSHVCFLALALLVCTCLSFCSFPMRHRMAFVAGLQEMRGSKRGASRERISIQPKADLVRKPKCRVSQRRTVDEVSILKS